MVRAWAGGVPAPGRVPQPPTSNPQPSHNRRTALYPRFVRPDGKSSNNRPADILRTLEGVRAPPFGRTRLCTENGEAVMLKLGFVDSWLPSMSPIDDP